LVIRRGGLEHRIFHPTVALRLRAAAIFISKDLEIGR
jgi:hypothetical protein